MVNVATLGEPFLNPSVPTSTRSSSQESQPLRMDDEKRKPRSLEDMEKEVEWLKTFMKEFEDEASNLSTS